MSLDKVLALAGTTPTGAGLDDELLFAAQIATGELLTLLAAADDEDNEKESEESGDDHDADDEGGGEHTGHATFKALRKRNVPAKRAASMCAKSDKNVKASQLAFSLQEILSGQPGRDLALVDLAAAPPSETAEGRRKAASEGDALPDGSYPIKDKKHLHSAAVLAASKHGDWQAAQRLIRRKARDMGVDVESLPGFGAGGSDRDGEKMAASMMALAAKAAGAGLVVAMNHAPINGRHSHAHYVTSVHEHEHQHVNDSRHDGGPLHRDGSQPRRGEMW
jgi:hypothetical protein